MAKHLAHRMFGDAYPALLNIGDTGFRSRLQQTFFAFNRYFNTTNLNQFPVTEL